MTSVATSRKIWAFFRIPSMRRACSIAMPPCSASTVRNSISGFEKSLASAVYRARVPMNRSLTRTGTTSTDTIPSAFFCPRFSDRGSVAASR